MSLIKKGNKLFSVLNLKCPRCNEGNLFKTKTFSFQTPFQMNHRCSECRQKYFLEPGFYYGAMFVSYLITGFFSLGFVTFCIFVLEMSVNSAFLFLIVVCAILLVWFFRTARAIWINVNVSYDAKAIEKAALEPDEEEDSSFVNRNF